MCKAIEDIREEARNEGIEQGAREKLLENVRSMVRNLGISARQALDVLDVPKSEQAGILAML